MNFEYGFSYYLIQVIACLVDIYTLRQSLFCSTVNLLKDEYLQKDIAINGKQNSVAQFSHIYNISNTMYVKKQIICCLPNHLS